MRWRAGETELPALPPSALVVPPCCSRPAAAGTPRYYARYDRVYCAGGVQPREVQLVADRPLTPAGDYLSDHFGLLVTLGFH